MTSCNTYTEQELKVFCLLFVKMFIKLGEYNMDFLSITNIKLTHYYNVLITVAAAETSL